MRDERNRKIWIWVYVGHKKIISNRERYKSQHSLNSKTKTKKNKKLQYCLRLHFSLTQSTGSFCCWCSRINNWTCKQVYWDPKHLTHIRISISPIFFYSGLMSFWSERFSRQVGPQKSLFQQNSEYCKYWNRFPFCERSKWSSVRVKRVSFSCLRSPFVRGDLSGMSHVPQKKVNLTTFYHLKKKKRNKKTTQIRKNSVNLPQNRIITSSAIKFNSLVSCV